jgi:hypothetical protein
MDLVAIPILAAEGLDWLLEKQPRRRVALGAALAAGFCAIASIGAWLLMHPHQTILPGFMAARVALAHLALVAGALAMLLALGWCGVLARDRAALAIAFLTLIDLLSIERGYVQPRPKDFAAGTERFAAVDWLIDEKENPQDRFLPSGNGPFRLHNVGMTYGLESAGGYDSLAVWRSVHLIWMINHHTPYPNQALKDDLAAGKVTRFDSPLIDLMNVRWALAELPPGKDWIERFSLSPNARLHARHEPSWDPRLKVFENPHVLPRAFIVYQAQVPTDEPAALLKLDPRQSAILDRAPDPKPISDLRQYKPAVMTVAERHRIVIEAETPVPGVLVVSETWYPGWRAFVDGKEVPLLRADYAFRGVALAPGKHVVEMRFSSRPTAIGLSLSTLGLLGLAALALWLALRGRRSPTVV